MSNSLQSGREPKRALRASFTDDVLAQALDLPKPTKKRTLFTYFQEIHTMKITHVSAATLSAVTVSTLLAGTAAAAAIYWFGANAATDIKDSQLTISVEDCTKKQIQGISDGNSNRYSFSEKYTIRDKNAITQDEIKQAQLAICEQRAIQDLLRTNSPDLQKAAAASPTENWVTEDGYYAPSYVVGTVKDRSNSSLTVEGILQQQADNSFVRVEHTLEIAESTPIFTNGNRVKINDLQKGDYVYFAYQNKVNPSSPIDPSNLASTLAATNLNADSVVRGVSAMATDYHVIEKFRKAQSDGILQTVSTDPSDG